MYAHFEFIFMCGVRECFNFILLHVAVHFQHYLLKRLAFLCCRFLLPLSWLDDHRCMTEHLILNWIEYETKNVQMLIQRMSTTVLMSHTSKVMLKILQAMLQQYMNCELPDVQSGFRKGRGTKDQIASICWIIKKARVPEKHLLLLSVQFNHTVMYDSLWPHGLQHARPPCPSPTPVVYSTHVHWVGDAIQPSHPLSSHSPPAFNLSQHQALFKWISSLHQVAKVLVLQLQHQYLQWTFRTDFL